MPKNEFSSSAITSTSDVPTSVNEISLFKIVACNSVPVSDSSIDPFSIEPNVISIVSSVSSPGAFKSSSIPFKISVPSDSPAKIFILGAKLY